MKFHKRSFLGAVLVATLFASCTQDNDEQLPEVTNEQSVFELVGTHETRTATAEELSTLSPIVSDKMGCILSSDEGCSDNAQSEFERYVRECTNYPRIWPPTGAVDIYYRSLIYYVDGDSDINLDQYQDDLQAQVTSIVGSGAAFVSADIIFWQCNDRQNNSCVIQYTVYR